MEKTRRVVGDRRMLNNLKERSSPCATPTYMYVWSRCDATDRETTEEDTDLRKHLGNTIVGV